MDTTVQNIIRSKNQMLYDTSRQMDMLNNKFEPSQPKKQAWYKRSLIWLFKGLAGILISLVIGTIYVLWLEPHVQELFHSLFH